MKAFEPTDSVTPSSRKRRVIVIDDDAATLRLVETILEKEGWDVTAYDDPCEGLKAALAHAEDPVILDVMMPVINGFNICRILRRQKGHEHQPVILLSSRDRPRDRLIGEEVGADAYLTKPIDAGQLVAAVRDIGAHRMRTDAPS